MNVSRILPYNFNCDALTQFIHPVMWGLEGAMNMPAKVFCAGSSQPLAPVHDLPKRHAYWGQEIPIPQPVFTQV